MRAYELVLVLRPTLKEDERKKLLNSVKDFLGKPENVKEDDWGQKSLSYAIKRETSGHYFRLVVEMEEGIPQDFEKKLVTHDGVLRHLFLRKEVVKKTKPETPKKEAKAKTPKKTVKKSAAKPKKTAKKSK